MNQILELPRRAQGEAFLVPRVWWLSPVVVSLFVAATSIISTAFLTDQDFRVLWRTAKSVTGETLLLFGCGAVALAFGAMIAIAVAPTRRSLPSAWPGLSEKSLRLLKRSSTVLTAMTIVGYAGFGYLILRSGLQPVELFSEYGSGINVKDIVGTIPGVTTLTQFGVAAVVISAVVMVHGYSRAELAKILVIGGLALLRAFVFSERLAILELLVPILVLLVANMSLKNGWRRQLSSVMPLALLVGAVTVFGFFEYFRSWTYYRTETTASYVDFVLSRFAGYYATALNNGHLVLEHLQWPNRLPYDTVEALWVAPVMESTQAYQELGGHSPPDTRVKADSLYNDVLFQFANPEFNNRSGYVSAFADYGTIGGIVAFLILGAVVGALYIGFRHGKIFGLLFYPVVFIGLVELPRYFYWAQGRSTYVWIGLLVVAVMVSRIEAKDRNA